MFSINNTLAMLADYIKFRIWWTCGDRPARFSYCVTVILADTNPFITIKVRVGVLSASC